MFTGIVHGIGRVRDRPNLTLEVEIPAELRGRLVVGGSIAVNGTCLTARAKTEHSFVADLSTETRSRTTLGSLSSGDEVNLELPVTPTGLLDGHLVLGHVDAVGRVKSIAREAEGWAFVFSYPPEFGGKVVEKGSVAVDGVSLTPFSVTGTTFRVAIIPATFEGTTLKARAVGDAVNLEFDLVAKYVEGMVRRVR
jgi:riboflavin synthase